jgi:hypothetical protein
MHFFSLPILPRLPVVDSLLRVAWSEKHLSALNIQIETLSTRQFRLLSPIVSPGESSGTAHQGKYFFHGSDLKSGRRTDTLQAIPHMLGETKQLELNVIVTRPLLKKYQHAEASTFHGFYLRQIEHNNPRVSLLGDGTA